MFDAIICDPPYGVRAGGRKSGGRKLLKGVIGPYTVSDHQRNDHIPSTAPYSLVECVHDLFDLAARMLVMRGRLVFFYPVALEDDSMGIMDNVFPEHPCFELIASSEQILSSRYSRVLLTMVKTSPYTADIEEAARLRHLDFRENHLKWLEDGNLHSAVFSPADALAAAETDTKVQIYLKHYDSELLLLVRSKCGLIFSLTCFVGVTYWAHGGSTSDKGIREDLSYRVLKQYSDGLEHRSDHGVCSEQDNRF
ncbi:hypothetical protein CRG98_033628, partial [Punica granatum]